MSPAFMAWMSASGSSCGSADPGPAAAGACAARVVVIVAVVGADAEERRCAELAEANRVGDIPDLLDAGALLVAQVVDGVMAVVDFDKPLAKDGGNVFGGDRPAEVGMVEVHEDFAAGAPGLLLGGAEVVVDRLGDGAAAERLDQFRQVRGVHDAPARLRPCR